MPKKLLVRIVLVLAVISMAAYPLIARGGSAAWPLAWPPGQPAEEPPPDRVPLTDPIIRTAMASEAGSRVAALGLGEPVAAFADVSVSSAYGQALTLVFPSELTHGGLRVLGPTATFLFDRGGEVTAASVSRQVDKEGSWLIQTIVASFKGSDKLGEFFEQAVPIDRPYTEGEGGASIMHTGSQCYEEEMEGIRREYAERTDDCTRNHCDGSSPLACEVCRLTALAIYHSSRALATFYCWYHGKWGH